MHLQKMLAAGLIFAVSAPLSSAFAELPAINNLDDAKVALTKHEARIEALEAKIKALSDELAAMKKGLSVAISTSTTTVTGSGTSTLIPTPTVVKDAPVAMNTGNAKYDKLIQMTNDTLAETLSTNKIDAKATIGLYEFIEPDAFFVSIDDGKNEAGITAFPYKFLYSYDKNNTISQIGFFKLDPRTQYYITVSGKNPYGKATRIRIKNPLYKGKLLEETQTSTSGTTATSSGTTNTIKPTTTTTSLSDVKKAYKEATDSSKKAGKTLYQKVLTLSDSYLANNESTPEIYQMRYKMYFYLGQYKESIDEIKKLQQIMPNFASSVYCADAKAISTFINDAATKKSFQDVCKK